jgi:hypothetical protein
MLQKTISESEDLEREQVYNIERIRDTDMGVEQMSIKCQHLH